MLVSDLQTGNPPVRHIWMLTIGDMKLAPAAYMALIAMIEILETMQIVQVPRNRRVLAVNFESVQRLVAAGVARRLERRKRPVAKTREEDTRVIDSDRLHLAGQIVFTALDKGLGRGRHFFDRAVEPHRGVDRV